MAKLTKNIIIVVGFLIAAIGISLIMVKQTKEKEFNQEVRFVIDSINVTPALRLSLYDDEKRIFPLESFTFYSSHDLKKGDVLLKKKHSNTLELYRLDRSGVLKKIQDLHE